MRDRIILRVFSCASFQRATTDFRRGSGYCGLIRFFFFFIILYLFLNFYFYHWKKLFRSFRISTFGRFCFRVVIREARELEVGSVSFVTFLALGNFWSGRDPSASEAVVAPPDTEMIFELPALVIITNSFGVMVIFKLVLLLFVIPLTVKSKIVHELLCVFEWNFYRLIAGLNFIRYCVLELISNDEYYLTYFSDQFNSDIIENCMNINILCNLMPSLFI